ncbi:MAG: KH domain-containing protein [Chloroflexi bacterium]|nr:KH domain-containing protein [Chloroflexota bacterium]
MRDLVEYIAKSIVNAPDDVVVTEESTEDEGILIKLQVADDDKGRVIGKQGRIAQAIRTLIRVKAAKQGTRATLEIL